LKLFWLVPLPRERQRGFFYFKAVKMRQAFNFYRSYWEVANELNDKDRLAFYDALLTRQFTGEETDLKGLVKFAYLSQKHSIDKQIKGYEDKTKRPLQDPTIDPTQGGWQGPSVQEKEKEKGKEEIDFQALLEFVNRTFGRNFKLINEKIKRSYNARLKEGYIKEQIIHAIKNAAETKYHKDTNYQYCTPEFFSRPEIIDKYSSLTIVTESDGILAHLKNN
jgi:uncharacterized phage protein (TIGR02220 family)